MNGFALVFKTSRIPLFHTAHHTQKGIILQHFIEASNMNPSIFLRSIQESIHSILIVLKITC